MWRRRVGAFALVSGLVLSPVNAWADNFGKLGELVVGVFLFSLLDVLLVITILSLSWYWRRPGSRKASWKYVAAVAGLILAMIATGWHGLLTVLATLWLRVALARPDAVFNLLATFAATALPFALAIAATRSCFKLIAWLRRPLP